MADNRIEEPLIEREVTIQDAIEAGAFIGRRPGVNSPGAMYQVLPIKWQDTSDAQRVFVEPNDRNTNGAVVVTTSLTVIVPKQPKRRIVQIQNRGPSSVFYGATTMEAETGSEIAPGFTTDVKSSDIIYGICVAGTADCRWFAVGD